MREALERGYHELDGDVPATPEAKQWKGWGTNLKPANEPIILARKPLSERNVAANVLKWGTGGLNIDGCRIPTNENRARFNRARQGGTSYVVQRRDAYIDPGGEGRFPANILLDEEAAAMLDEQSGATFSKRRRGKRPGKVSGRYGAFSGQDDVIMGHSDSGGASRFFYVAKASRSERTMGGKVENDHPTVKPIKLMRYLCRLITPPGGTVLDRLLALVQPSLPR